MGDRWLTGRGVLENYGLQVFELASLLEGGLPAYEPDTGNRYISPKDCKKVGDVLPDSELRERYEPVFRKFVSAGFEGVGISMEDAADLYPQKLEELLKRIAGDPYPPTGHTILNFSVHPKSDKYEVWLSTIMGALFHPDDVEEATARLKGDPTPLEHMAAPEHQSIQLGASERPRKTPEELLQLHERGMSINDLAKNFYGGTGDPTNTNTTRGWAKDQINKAKKARAKNGPKNPA